METRLLKLQQKRASPSYGRQVYFRDLMRELSSKLGGASMSRAIRTQAMKHHGALYSALAALCVKSTMIVRAQ